MTIIGGFNRVPLPTNQQIMQVTPTPQSDATVNAAIKQSVQEFPPAINTGAFFAEFSQRGAYLPSYGTRDRDRVLRLLLRNENNNLVQAVVSSLIKKLVTIPYQINGSNKDLISIPDDNGRMHTISEVDHAQNVLQNAQFGAGWEAFYSRYLEDFLTQDFGGVMELSGAGEPIYPIEGPVMGIAQLDAGRCYITGNPYYPIMYFSLISGSLHRMHARRVVRLVDSPSPDERYFGIGLCALSRTVAVANRQMLMNRYIEGLVDDKPPPGIMLTQGFTETSRNKSMELYKREQSADERPIWGKTLWIYSLDADKPIKAEHFPFSQAPEKFDWVKYTELDVHALAAGFNIDIQEIWELTGRGGAGGNSGQSQTLHQKSEAKMIGFVLQNTERIFNRSVFSPRITMEFKYNDPVQQETEATVDGQLATNAVALVTGQVWNTLEARNYLAAQSDRFKDAQQAQRDTITAPDAADSTIPDDTATQDVQLPQPPAQPMLGAGPTKPQTGAAPMPPTGAAPKPPTGVQPKLGAAQPKQPASSPLNAAHASNPRKQRPGNQMPAGIKEIKLKYNAYHDERGRFTSGGSSGGGNAVTYRPKGSKQPYRLNKYDSPIGPELSPTRSINSPANNEPVKPQTIHKFEVATQDGKTAVNGQAKKVGDFIVHGYVSYEGGEPHVTNYGYSITHEPTGMALPGGWKRQSDAIAAAQDYHEVATGKDLTKVSRGSEINRAMLDVQDKHRATGYRSLRSASKNFSITSRDFEREFRAALTKGIDGKLDKAAFEEKLLDMLSTGGFKAYADGLRAGGADGSITDDHLGDIHDFLVGQVDYIDGLGNQLAAGNVAPQVQKSYKAIGTKDSGDVFRIIARKARQWVNKSLRVMFEKGRLFADPDSNYEFVGEDGNESCPTCQRLKGQVHPLRDWHAAGLVPQIDTDGYDCKGFKCMHTLARTNAPENGVL